MEQFEFPKRTIHLDFHTGPDVPDVGREFDPKAFAKTFKEARVDSVTVFGMCHHGHLYYETDHPARHPSLPKELDLMGEQIDALHSEGIRAPIYISVQVNEYAANQHPEWMAIDEEGKRVKRGHGKWGFGPFDAAWQILDMSSPYQDYVADIIEEILKKYAPIDGLFLDMCWDQPSCSSYAIERMKKKAHDPESSETRAAYAREVVHEYMMRYRKMLDAYQKGRKPAGIWFNSRPKTNLHTEKKYVRHIEIEALPTGGWGYAYFPYVARFVRPLGLPTLSHTGRFFKSWGDNTSLKPEAALKYECCQILSQNMANGIGDLLHPRGVPAKPVYDLIGTVYKHIEACEPYVEGGTIESQIAMIVDPEIGDKPGPAGLGATRALQQLRQQFDILPPSADLTSYEMVLVPETTRIGEELKRKLTAYLNGGGSMIIFGPAALDAEDRPVMDELGIETFGLSPYSHTFLHAENAVSEGLANYGYVMYERGFRMKPAGSAETLVTVGEPYFERTYDRFSGHDYTAEDSLSEYAAVVKKERVITFSVPLLEAYGKHGAPNYRTLLGNCIDLLVPYPLIRDKGPSKLETTVVDTRRSRVVHLLCFSPERRVDDLDIVEDALPLVNMPIAVRFDKTPSRVFLAPGEVELDFEYKDGYVHTAVTVLGGHALLVVEE
ncbi:MAG: hypothetical protein EA383_16475 [Spirochaetaceae bacterium]|nr:MAG: hypothetical protein EA383_16475 [Spirochaetaceae bacterium]